ncbi:MAG: TIGR02757 family protein [Bacteroidetes bacterium]|nr:MAG: TIGR02757 family protein [Bacteroidota bacterium]
MSRTELYNFLEEKHDQYNRHEFIESDPISIPHQFTKKEDIEISGFLTATIAWGNRKMILRNANRLMELMDNAPYDFIKNFTDKDLKAFEGFVHRTFKGTDCVYFLKSLRNIYKNHGGLEGAFSIQPKSINIKETIISFHNLFFELEHQHRTRKHVANPERNSAAKRINMFLRWMVRNDKRGVDFGIWDKLPTNKLLCPLDVHSGNTARKLGLLTRNANDWKATEELTESLREFDNSDPVKYDFALFGLGVFEKF